MNEYEDELTGLEEHLRDTLVEGDARRCPHHPEVKTSSDDGMFDAPCYKCEGAMSNEVERWDHDLRNPCRHYCGLNLPRVSSYYYTVACVPTDEDNIPF
jgi:hypothetical protein